MHTSRNIDRVKKNSDQSISIKHTRFSADQSTLCSADSLRSTTDLRWFSNLGNRRVFLFYTRHTKILLQCRQNQHQKWPDLYLSQGSTERTKDTWDAEILDYSNELTAWFQYLREQDGYYIIMMWYRSGTLQKLANQWWVESLDIFDSTLLTQATWDFILVSVPLGNQNKL